MTKKAIYNDVANNLKKIRNSKGLTGQQVAELGGFDSASAVSHLENDGRDITFENLTKYLNALDITFSECLNIKSERQVLKEKIKHELEFNLSETEQEFFASVISTLKDIEGN